MKRFDRVAGQVCVARENDDFFYARNSALQRCECGQQGRIDEQQSVLGVVDDVFDLLREQPRVDRVQYGAHAGDRVVKLQVPVVVPGERADTVAGSDPRRLQRIGQLSRSAKDVPVRAAMPRMIGRN